jgi:hypothetical protein
MHVLLRVHTRYECVLIFVQKVAYKSVQLRTELAGTDATRNLPARLRLSPPSLVCRGLTSKVHMNGFIMNIAKEMLFSPSWITSYSNWPSVAW